MTQAQKISYKDAGVDLEVADALVEKIKARVQSTYGENVVSGVGGFAALYKSGGGKILAAGTDGVGTKVKLAQGLNKHDTIGIDLVAMCANDIICTGATPLFFLDYLAMAKIDLAVLDPIVAGIAAACKDCGMALIGGETAEMPDVYKAGEYDLAGFAVGEMDAADVIDGARVREGDALLALPSSGIHSNGFSLVRKLIRAGEKDLLLEALSPTRLYWQSVKDIRPLAHGMAHITGGGLGNIPRMNGAFDYVIDHLPEPPAIFGVLAERSHLDAKDLYETFNMGLGFVIATDKPDDVIKKTGAVKIGHVAAGGGKVRVAAGKINFII
ncbi:MAG: phosphoribosylformylglycinamidine cyclo-ligase [Alphaproteobacteria bacterium]|nr:phosphoribosylformylglycinamidine cyclo-ligase [Alphaproteobacteria bacterium]MDE2337435.1 phosphoribosylformylglycinamidine cyclo-ligase [Alphaproteobacteria bacterium]